MSAPRRLGVEAGLEAERQLLARVHAGEVDGALLCWRPTDRALVMPRRLARLPGFLAAEADCGALGWPVALRDTGGEPVPQSPAVLNVALAVALPPEEGERERIEAAYLRLCEPLCDWLRGFGLVPGLGEVPGAFCDGRFNVTLGRRKLVGTAQRWRRTGDGRLVVLVHGALLMEDEREAMVEVVNRFYQGCGLDTHCRADSHVALEEWLSAPWSRVEGLASLLGRGWRLSGPPCDVAA
ncbi:lipoate--protein ligase family protein [Metapseudomonas furukawaii]|jgi:lipoate-protein ligase A|uniref:lipoate--protein ligase family protein n=1 Tax=Metapseudomonas furukawaii TaxID=1149133 RepID=UPI004045FF5A